METLSLHHVRASASRYLFFPVAKHIVMVSGFLQCLISRHLARALAPLSFDCDAQNSARPQPDGGRGSRE
jgi:hypothetical protein